MTVALVGFLAVHGLLHFAIWFPHSEPDPGKAPPFHPDHSTVLAAVSTPRTAVHQLSLVLAAGTAATYLLAAIAVALGVGWAAPVAVAAGLFGLLLKVLYFHRWRVFGAMLDLAVLLAGTLGWPVNIP